jgi:hypothetical protein
MFELTALGIFPLCFLFFFLPPPLFFFFFFFLANMTTV